jgi:hypothetical protein
MDLKPSKSYCHTGDLLEGEKYNQLIHNTGNTREERCAEYYSDYKDPDYKDPDYTGGKSRKKRRKSKKSRKNRRKSIRRR